METGSRVQVKHYRVPVGFGFPRRYFRGHGFQDAGFNGIAPSGRGGATMAEVQVNGQTYVIEATFPEERQFNYRIGRLIATGRLRKRLEQEGLLDKVALL